MAGKVKGSGTPKDPWVLQTPSLQSEFQMARDPGADPPALICTVGSTELRYHLRAIDDLHAMLKKHGDWMPLGSADEQKPAKEGTVEAWGRAESNPVGGWYGLKKGLRGGSATTCRRCWRRWGSPRSSTTPRTTACALAVSIGVVAMRRPSAGYAGLAVFGLIGVAAALTRPTARPIDAFPSVVGGFAGALMLWTFLRTLSPSSSTEPPARPTPAGIDRRRFFLTGAAGVAAALVAGGAGRVFARRFEADASRAAVHLPSTTATAGPPAGADLRVPGLSPFITPNDRFYRVDTALLVPVGEGRGVAAPGPRDGRARVDPHVRSTDGPPADRARHHPHLRLERGGRASTSGTRDGWGLP